MEWAISIIIGFLVFEIISKWVKKKLNPYLLKYKGYLPSDWVGEEEGAPAAVAVQPVPVPVQPAPEKAAGASGETVS